MTLKNFKNTFKNTLIAEYPNQEIQSFFRMLAKDYLNMSAVQMIFSEAVILEKAVLEKLEKALFQLKNHQPIQYILGYAYFKDLKIKVNDNVLIPRIETEALVDWIVEDFKNSPNLKILEVGSGTGCVSIALKKHLKANVEGMDICEKTLEIAFENAKANDVKINFRKSDILKVKHLKKYEVIVSNPPYIKESEKGHLPKNVLYEPQKALFVPNADTLVFYKKIAALALRSLPKNGALYFEIPEKSYEAILKMLRGLGFRNCILRRDLFGKYRMIKAIL